MKLHKMKSDGTLGRELTPDETEIAKRHQEESYQAYIRSLDSSEEIPPLTFNRGDIFEVPYLDGRVVDFEVMRAGARRGWLNGEYWLKVIITEA